MRCIMFTVTTQFRPVVKTRSTCAFVSKVPVAAVADHIKRKKKQKKKNFLPQSCIL